MMKRASLSVSLVMVLVFQASLVMCNAVAETNRGRYWTFAARPTSLFEPSLRDSTYHAFRIPHGTRADVFALRQRTCSGQLDELLLSRQRGVELSAFHLGSSTDGSDFDPGQIHEFLGLTTIVMSGIAVLSSSNRSVHHAAAYATTAAAVATFLTGYIAYGDRFNLNDGIFSKYNLHMILGTLGTIGCATATVLADSDNESTHGGIGGAGASSMWVTVIIVKW